MERQKLWKHLLHTNVTCQLLIRLSFAWTGLIKSGMSLIFSEEEMMKLKVSFFHNGNLSLYQLISVSKQLPTLVSLHGPSLLEIGKLCQTIDPMVRNPKGATYFTSIMDGKYKAILCKWFFGFIEKVLNK